MMTTNEALAIYRVAEFLDRNSILRADGGRFSFGWATKLIRFFEAEPAAKSVDHPATIWLEGQPHEGVVTVYRTGHKTISLN